MVKYIKHMENGGAVSFPSTKDRNVFFSNLDKLGYKWSCGEAIFEYKPRCAEYLLMLDDYIRTPSEEKQLRGLLYAGIGTTCKVIAYKSDNNLI